MEKTSFRHKSDPPQLASTPLGTHLFPEHTFSLTIVYPQRHIFSLGPIISPSPPFSQKTSSPRANTFSLGNNFFLAHILSLTLSPPWASKFPWAHLFPYHYPSQGTHLFVNHILPSLAVLLIRIFMNFHEFLNSSKKVMFVINKDLGL